MESIDPSLERRGRSSVLSAGESSGLNTLTDFLTLMAEAKIDGPHEQRDIHLIGKYLGSGAQFDVYGHQHVARRGFPLFDEPFVSTGPKPSSRAGARPVVVAVKRPRFKFGVGEPAMGFGTPTQLRALELEIYTLCNESIRNHRNIVKLLAWGLEDSNAQDRVVEPHSPFLVLEHGNCSLQAFLANDKGTIPWQVLQKLMFDVSQGLSILHASHIIHGDLKSDNVLVFPDEEGPYFGIAKLSDFGLSVLDQTAKIFNIGTFGWLAPELPSDKGIGAEMLVKCDYFSLGLVIFSTLLKDGSPPLGSTHPRFALQLAKDCLVDSNILPQAARDRISSVLELLLEADPSDRASDLETINHLLKYAGEEPFDSQGAWVNGRFDDNTPWGESVRTVYGSTMILGACSSYASADMVQPILNQNGISYSWREIHRFLRGLPSFFRDRITNYYISNIDTTANQRTESEDVPSNLVGEEITGDQLLGLCFSDSGQLIQDYEAVEAITPRVARRLRASCAAVAATKGYFPAQAVALKLLDDTNSTLLKLVRFNDTRWQWNAVSTGYYLAWEFASENPEKHESALAHFRRSGGYNSHYICPQFNNDLKRAYTDSGILVSPLAGLTEFPLHYAAVCGDVLGIERLLESHHVDSTDEVEETPLHLACMAGAYEAVCCLVRHGADPTIKSKRLGTVPLHWLFVFEPKHVHDVAILLTPAARGESVLHELAAPDAGAFHYPFEWPVGTPLAWAVLSNRAEAVDVLLALGSNFDSIPDFFPGHPQWDKRIRSSNPEIAGYPVADDDDPHRRLWSVWIYLDMERYRLPAVQRSPSYQKQLLKLSIQSDKRAQLPKRDVLSRYSRALNTATSECDPDSAKKLPNQDVLSRYSRALNTTTSECDLDAAKQLPNRGVLSRYSRALNTTASECDLDATKPLPDPYVLNHRDRALHTAVSEGNLDVVKQLVDRGTNINVVAKDTYGGEKTALKIAIEQTNPVMVQFLIDHGAQFDGHDSSHKQTPLLLAVHKKHLGIVEILLKHGAEVNTQRPGTHRRGTALFEAALAGSTAIAKLLLQYNADPLIETEGQGSALEAAVFSNNSELADIFLERGANPNTPGKIGDIGNALQTAANKGNEKILRALLEKGGDPNIRGGLYETALQAAINPTTHRMWRSQTGVVRLLLEKRADVTIDGGKYGSIMQAAACSGDVFLAKRLLKAGAPVGIGGGPHGSALQAAVACSEDLGLVQLLLDHGANPNFEGGEDFKTPLLLAAHKENEKQVECC